MMKKSPMPLLEEDVSTHFIAVLEERPASQMGSQQDARNENLFNTHVTHKWPCHLDAYAGSVLAPHCIVVDVQKTARLLDLHSPGLVTGTWRILQHCGSHAWPLHLCTRIAWMLEARRSGCHDRATRTYRNNIQAG